MRFAALVLILVMLGCSPPKRDQPVNQQEKLSLLTELKGEWQMLTEWGDGTQVIFHPCDADNMMLQISGDTLTIGWGQDASIGLIQSFYTNEEDRVVLSVKDLDENETKTYYFQFEDESQKVSRWWLFNDDFSEMFVHETIAADYSSYDQPCHECWDDCGDE